MIFRHLLIGVLGVLMAAPTPALAKKDALRLAYWTSGYSLGFGAVLEGGDFLTEAGVEAEFRRFSEVSAPAKAVLSGDVDIAFAAPAAAAFNLGRQGAPIRVILATQRLDGQIVVRKDSPIRSVADLAGKRIGMSRPGSSTHAIATTLLDAVHGVAPSAYAVVPGNEAQLAHVLTRGDIDAAALRNVTVAQLPHDTVRPVADIVEDWKTLTNGTAAPILAVALTRADIVATRGEDLAAFVRAMQAATAWGSANERAVVDRLMNAAGLDERSARDYASLWDVIYIASLTDADIAALKEENRIFVKAGAAEGIAPDEIYATGPFSAATENRRGEAR